MERSLSTVHNQWSRLLLTWRKQTWNKHIHLSIPRCQSSNSPLPILITTSLFSWGKHFKAAFEFSLTPPDTGKREVLRMEQELPGTNEKLPEGRDHSAQKSASSQHVQECLALDIPLWNDFSTSAIWGRKWGTKLKVLYFINLIDMFFICL